MNRDEIKIFDIIKQETDTISFIFQSGIRTDIVKVNNEYRKTKKLKQ